MLDFGPRDQKASMPTTSVRLASSELGVCTGARAGAPRGVIETNLTPARPE